jgi:rod shape-determining protein MreC
LFVLLKRYRDLILVAVLLLVPLGVFFAHAKRPADQSRFDRTVMWVTAPVEKAVAWSITGLLDGWSGYVALRHAHDRAMELSREVNLLRMERDQLIQERAEAERIRTLLSFAEAAPQRTYVGARVIGVRVSAPGLQLVTIDRGSGDGVQRAMPVVVADGVVGRVHSVTTRTADVLLLVDRNSSIAVRVERTRARGNVRGLGKPDACKLDYALRTEDMTEGDVLVTAGTDGVFPRGLAVGRVTQLKKNGHGLFQDAVVVPAVDVARVEELLVITSAEVTPPEADAEPMAASATPRAPGVPGPAIAVPAAVPAAVVPAASVPAASVPAAVVPAASVPAVVPAAATPKVPAP